MNVLVINSGSSSLKYQLIDMQTEQVLGAGLCERIGMDGRIIHKTGGEKKVYDLPLGNHTEALSKVIQLLCEGERPVIGSKEEIAAIGHRIATLSSDKPMSVVLDDQILSEIEATVEMAPLHVPAMVGGIKACRAVFGNDFFQVVVSDTGFHNTIPLKAQIYGIPYEYYEKYGLRRLGYHGTSHRYVAAECAKRLGRDITELKIITCHLGNGSSVSAIKGGVSIDNSMGYTPLEGVMMGTRCGSIDPMLIPIIAKKENLSLDEVMYILQNRSGLLGVSGISSDDRDIRQAAAEGNPRAILARDALRYQVKKYIGAYTAALGGLDALVFTGGIGENSDELRRDVCADLEQLGIILDPAKNDGKRGEGEISADNSPVRVWVIPTNEELMIAREARSLYLQRGLQH